MHDSLLDRFDDVRPLLCERADAAQRAVSALLSRIEGLKAHSVTSRVKSAASLSAKLQRPDRSYLSLWSVTDLVGVRVIVYFQDDVERVGELIEANLPVDYAHSIDKRRGDAASFGYRSLHYVCHMWPAATDGELSREARFEIQVRTVLDHAWAEVEHDIGYKSAAAAPAHVRRRLHRIAGLLELADQEFGAVRDDLRDYARRLPARIASGGDSVPLDRLSLDALLACDEVRDLDRHIADTLGRELGEAPFYPDYLLKLLQSSGIGSVGEARSGIARHASLILSMVKPYFAFAWETWQLSPAQMDRIFRGYSLFFLAHAETLSVPTLGIGKVERLARLYRELDYPDDERAAILVASRLVEAFGDLGSPPGSRRSLPSVD